MKSVAIVSTYAPSEQFGGPARIHHMRRLLEQHGYQVTHVIVDSTNSRGNIRKTDLHLTVRTDRATFDPMYDDLALGDKARSKATVDAVVQHLRQQQVSLIVMEQPFLSQMVSEVIAIEPIPVIYSSANIEYRLRKELERFAPNRARTPESNRRIRDLEQLSVDIATAVTAICATDAALVRDEYGADAVTVVPNGSVAAESALTSPRQTQRRYFAFAGSAYWPNTEGLADVATPSLAFLPPDVRLEIAGAVCGPLREHPQLTLHHAVNFGRLSLNGFLPMRELIDLMYHSLAVLVPITIGQGSNLKTADALASGAPAILTERAVRGYEDVLAADSEGVVVVDSISDFRAAMRAAVEAPIGSAMVGATRRQMLTWSQRLRPFAELVKSHV